MKKIIILSLSNLLLLICACTNEVLTQSTECFRVMGFLDDVSRTTFINNGNITDTHWVKNDSIGLYTTTEQNILYTALNSGKNTEFTSLETDIDFEENKNVYAYYPYTDSIKGENIKLPNTKDMSSKDSNVSFLYSNSLVSENKLNLYFNHLYAYLQMKLSTKTFSDKFSSMAEGCYKKEGIYLEIMSTEYISTSNAWFNVETNKISYDEKGVSKRLYYYCDDLDFNTIDTLNYMIPILPQAEGTDISIYIVFPAIVDGYEDGNWIYKLPLFSKTTPIGGFKAGHVYTVNTVDDIEPSSDQYKVLEDLYQSTNGHLWKNNTYWLTDKPLDNWFGINGGPVKNSYVYEIDLKRNILTGTLPSSFTKIMDCAQDIDLSFNGMSGEIPDVIKEHKRWNDIGWNIIAQDTRLSDGFNLEKSNLYQSDIEFLNILDSCKFNLEEVLANNKFTQIIWHSPYDIKIMKDLFTESHVNLHLDYREKGLNTIIFLSYSNDLKLESDFIKKTYGDIKGITWGKVLTHNYSGSRYSGMSYIFNSECQLVYFAPYYLEPYSWIEDKKNNIVHQKYNSFLKSTLGDPNEHEEFKFLK